MIGWNLQYLENENLWYLAYITEKDGITFEGWYYSEEQAKKEMEYYGDNKYLNNTDK